MDVIPRIAAFLIATLLAIDAFSGLRTETLKVDRHTRVANWRNGDEHRLHLAAALGLVRFERRVGGDERGWWFG